MSAFDKRTGEETVDGEVNIYRGRVYAILFCFASFLFWPRC